MAGRKNAGKARLFAAAVEALAEARGDRVAARVLFREKASALDALDYAAAVFIGRACAPPRAAGGPQGEETASD